MSEHSEKESWLDEWGLLLVITYGLIFVACLICFNPTW